MALVAIKIGRRQGGPSRTGRWRAHIWTDTLVARALKNGRLTRGQSRAIPGQDT
jgi:hypothetical protein